MKMSSIFAAFIVAVVTLPSTAQTTRIGTFDKRSIVVAYYRSPQWAEVLEAKLAELKQAKATGDTKKAEELEAWGKAHQETAHRQLAGDAPINNIFDALKPALPEIARKAQVSNIVMDPPRTGPGIQIVDVTDQLLDWLKADARTRSIIKDLREK